MVHNKIVHIITAFLLLTSSAAMADNITWGNPQTWLGKCDKGELGKIEKYALYDVDGDDTPEFFICDTNGNYGLVVYNDGNPRCVMETISSTSLSIATGKPFVRCAGGCGTGCYTAAYCRIVSSKEDVTYTHTTIYGPEDQEEHVFDVSCGGNEKSISEEIFRKQVPVDGKYMVTDILSWHTLDAQEVYNTEEDVASNSLGVYVKDKTSPTNVRSTPRGKVVGTLKNGDMIQVDRCENGWWHIADNSYDDGDYTVIISRESDELWIHSSVVTMDWAADGGVNFTMYAQPDPKSRIMLKGKGSSYKILSILDLDGDWVKIKVTGNVVGWVSRAVLCGNSLTTCC